MTHEFPPFRGGIGRYGHQLAAAAAELGHQVTVMAPDYGQDRFEADRALNYQVRRFPGRPYRSREHLRALLVRSWAAARQHGRRYDVIHAIDWPHVMAMAFVHRFLRTPFLATVHGSDILRAHRSRQVRLLGVRSLYRTPARILANSEFTRRLLLERYPTVDPDRIRVTLLGVDRWWFESTRREAGEEARRQLGIPEGNALLITVARVDERKGHRTVIQAVAKLKPELRARLSYVIVGRPENEAYVAGLRRLSSGVGAHVVLAGQLPDGTVRSLYGVADLFCMPGQPHFNKVEGFGLVYLEAAAQGLPAIASPVGGVPEVVLNGKTGVLVPPADADELARELEALLTHRDRLGELGCEARRWAAGFTWERCARETYGL